MEVGKGKIPGGKGGQDKINGGKWDLRNGEWEGVINGGKKGGQRGMVVENAGYWVVKS